MDIDHGRILGQLSAALRRLAWTATEQRQWLQEIGTAPSADELGLEFDQWVETAPQLYRAGLLSDESTALLARVNLELDDIDKHKELWDVSGLDAPEWDRVREAAADALAALRA